MQPIQRVLPSALLERGLLSQDADALTWSCPTCGTIRPGRWTAGWFYRRLCPCQREALEQQRRQEEQQQMWHVLAEQRRRFVYGWLGSSWPQKGLEGKTFASFDRTEQPEAFEQVQAWTRQPQGTLLLYGSYGTGKTHLLAAIANTRREQGKAVLFASAVTLFDAIQERIRQEQDYHDLLKQAIAAPVFLLDDVDKPKPSDFRQEMYYQILDGRTRLGLPTALSCNGSPAGLDRFVGGAARSRLMQGVLLVEMSGQDYRLSKPGGSV